MFEFSEQGDTAAPCNIKTHMLITTNGYLKMWKNNNEIQLEVCQTKDVFLIQICVSYSRQMLELEVRVDK